MKKTDESTIEIIEDTELVGTGFILEKGDKVRILTEAVDISETTELANSIDFTGLLAWMNRKGLPISAIKIVKISNSNGKSIIECEGTPVFSGDTLGIFSSVFSTSVFKNAPNASDIIIDKQGAQLWWAVWGLYCVSIDKRKKTEASAVTSWYDFSTNEWSFVNGYDIATSRMRSAR